jgi:flavin-dependent dehydrogenase
MTRGKEHDGVFDAVVLGAGPSGSATAGELARRELRTALIVGSGIPRSNIGECLPPSIRPQLEKAGVWEEFLRAEHTPSLGMRSAWGSPELADRDFLFSPYGAGWHIDRTRFDLMMRNSAIRSGAESLDSTAFRGLEPIPDGWRLHLAQDSGDYHVDARLVVDATGRASIIARRTGAKRNSLDRLAGVAGYFSLHQTLSSIEPVLLVEAVENGWWYTAPLPDGKLIAVFMTDADIIQRQKLTQADRWMTLLGSTLQQSQRIKEHGLQWDGAIRIVSAESSFLDRIAGDGWLAAGDAAAAFDPLSSQGLITAISSGLDAAQTAAAWLSGDEHAPASYAKRLRHGYAEYLAHRGIYYGFERRWPESSFWKTRHAAPPALVPIAEAVCV